MIVMQARYMYTAKVMTDLMDKHPDLHSPIVSCHYLAMEKALPKEYDFWQSRDRDWVINSEEVWALKMTDRYGTWENSTGMQDELVVARNHGKTIRYLDCKDYNNTKYFELLLQLAEKYLLKMGAIEQETKTPLFSNKDKPVYTKIGCGSSFTTGRGKPFTIISMGDNRVALARGGTVLNSVVVSDPAYISEEEFTSLMKTFDENFTFPLIGYFRFY